MDAYRAECTICPRRCRLKEGQRGFCFIRKNINGIIKNTSYGQVFGAAADPIEKKPLYHFIPKSRILSFGTLGCNMGCRFCQNFHLSKSRSEESQGYAFSPKEAAQAALQHGCTGLAFTYNDPVIWYDYALECAEECRRIGLKSAAVSAGYINPEYARKLFSRMDAANIDLKSFSSDFYKKYCSADIKHVLNTLKYIKHSTKCWLEITTLLIPGLNDSDSEVSDLAAWVKTELGEEVPLHLSAFHPAYKMTHINAAPAETVIKAAETAKKSGLKHVYTGNIYYPEGQITYCSGCGAKLIDRNAQHAYTNFDISSASCLSCRKRLAGVFT